MIDFEAEFPELFAPPAMGCWSEVPKGWEPIVRVAVAGLDALRASAYPDLRVDQVKEKYAGLCIYTQGGAPAAYTITESATDAAVRTCQQCGSVRDVAVPAGPWRRRLCAACREAR